LQKTAEKTLAGVSFEEPTLEIAAWMGLADLDLELASALEPLAPFGAGNPRLILACHDLALEKAVPIGRSQEHLKLTVTDGIGNSSQVLWWNGAGEERPSGRFDLAFSLRASTWHGGQETQLVFADWHPVEMPVVALISRKLEIRDFRAEMDPKSLLGKLRLQPSTLIFAEGEEKAGVEGVDRAELTPVDHLVLWSIPPSPEELRLIMEKVKPQVVSLVCAAPARDQAKKFMPRLLGLLKFIVNQRNGMTSIVKLAAATGQRIPNLQRGLDWCIAHGDFVVESREEDTLVIRTGSSGKDAAACTRIWADLQSLLAEADAYRAHFRAADLDGLLPGIGYN
jgi:single-stranded-DNA-specific exonuclease